MPKVLVNVLLCIAIIVCGFVVWRIGVYVIRKMTSISRKKDTCNYRLDTLSTISISLYKYVIVIITLFSVLLYGFNFNAQAIVATLGVSGLIIGLALQSLIKDIVTGIFIIIENQFNVGELVTIKGMKGTIVELGLRATKLIDENQDICIIPNNEITVTINHSRKESEKSA